MYVALICFCHCIAYNTIKKHVIYLFLLQWNVLGSICVRKYNFALSILGFSEIFAAFFDFFVLFHIEFSSSYTSLPMVQIFFKRLGYMSCVRFDYNLM